MSDNSQVAEIWNQIRTEILERSKQADSVIPAMTSSQVSYLNAIVPRNLSLEPPVAELLVPDKWTRNVVEGKLRNSISVIITDLFGATFDIIVDIDPEAVRRAHEQRDAEAIDTVYAPAPEPYPVDYSDVHQEESPASPAAEADNAASGAAGTEVVSATASSSDATGAAPKQPATQEGATIPLVPKSEFPVADAGQGATASVQGVAASEQGASVPVQGGSGAARGVKPAVTLPPAAATGSATGSVSGAPGSGNPVSGAASVPASPHDFVTPKRNPAPAPRIGAGTAGTPADESFEAASLNPQYTFDNFVVGSSNRFAQAAAFAVAESPATAYNPLFIWGGSGLGKTHLLHAAGSYAQELAQGRLRVKYVSSEEFTNDYINSVRDDRQESFKRRYRNLDILMVDDIQFFTGKEGTQEEFFHTFNALHQANKQIILSSDRPPHELTTLEHRLRTRFEGGLITDIQPPDLETRVAILAKKAQREGTSVDREVLELIASTVSDSIRELEGALIRVVAYCSLQNLPLNIESAGIALANIGRQSDDLVISVAMIMEACGEYFDFSIDDLRGGRRQRPLAYARQVAMYLCRELTNLSLPVIGKEFGGRDHTTVMHNVNRITDKISTDMKTFQDVQEITSRVKSRKNTQ